MLHTFQKQKSSTAGTAVVVAGQSFASWLPAAVSISKVFLKYCFSVFLKINETYRKMKSKHRAINRKIIAQLMINYSAINDKLGVQM